MDTNNNYGVLEMQKQLLELLKVFCTFCRDNNIKFSVSSGTLLGAVRHKGFIPWDDDIDIVTDRQNYKKLISNLPNAQLSIEHGTKESFWIDRVRLNHFDSEVKPTIDVFIFDSAPVNSVKCYSKIMSLKLLQGMMKEKPKYEKYSLLYRIISFTTYCLGKPFSQMQKVKWYNKVSEWGNDQACDSFIMSNDQFTGFQYRYPKYLFDEICYLPFEDSEVPAMERYDEYLTMIYGDYMTPPDNSRRKPSHSN